MGLATTLALLGVGASFAGKAYGQIGQGLPLAAASLAVVMGLNLLEVFIHSILMVLAILGFIFFQFLVTFLLSTHFKQEGFGKFQLIILHYVH